MRTPSNRPEGPDDAHVRSMMDFEVRKRSAQAPAAGTYCGKEISWRAQASPGDPYGDQATSSAPSEKPNLPMLEGALEIKRSKELSGHPGLVPETLHLHRQNSVLFAEATVTSFHVRQLRFLAIQLLTESRFSFDALQEFLRRYRYPGDCNEPYNHGHDPTHDFTPFRCSIGCAASADAP